jgi:hypothetical protein
MKNKIGRNATCPCGSGKKIKKCCMIKSDITFAQSWMENDGMHIISPIGPSTPQELEEMTKKYQKNIKSSPIWSEMVKQYGAEKAEEMLKEFQVKIVKI